MRVPWVLVACSIAVAGGGLGLAAGCSSNASTHSALGTDGGDASLGETGPQGQEAAADAGPDIDQDPDVYPSQHHPIPQITYNGGAILQHPRLVTVTFTGNAHRDALRAFTHFITTTQWWQQTAEGYCIDAGPNAGCVNAGTTAAPDGGFWAPDGSTADGGDGHLDVELGYDFASSAIGDSDIQTWLAGHITAGDFPAADSQTVYVLYFPTSTSISLDPQDQSCEQFGGYHSETTVNGNLVAYAVLPYCDYGQGDLINYQQLTLAASHEIAEAATDPHPDQDTAFYLQGNDAWLGALSYGGGECGDMCTYVADETYNESGYTVQRIWSNQAAAESKQPCQPWDPVYFAAALRTTPQNLGPHPPSDGYVVVHRGQSTDVVADVFSQAALPHDLQLYAGQAKQGATDPSDMAPPNDQITVTLSKTQVHNGNGVVVTFAAPSSAQPGDFRLVIRAVLETNDYNDWPVIVHVE